MRILTHNLHSCALCSFLLSSLPFVLPLVYLETSFCWTAEAGRQVSRHISSGAEVLLVWWAVKLSRTTARIWGAGLAPMFVCPHTNTVCYTRCACTSTFTAWCAENTTRANVALRRLEGPCMLLCYSMKKVLLLYQQCDWSLSHWRKPERSILKENGDVMGREGTSQPSCFCSLLLCLPVPPSLSLSVLFFMFFFPILFFFALAGYSFYSSGITEFKPNSSLARPLKGTAGRDVTRRLRAPSCILLLHPQMWCSLILLMLPRSLASHSIWIPRLVLKRFVRCFRDADSSFVTVTVRNVKHLLRLDFPPEEFHASTAPPPSTPLLLSCRLQRRTTGSVCRGETTSRLDKPPSFPRLDHPTVKRREERKENKIMYT